jgi:hypothetical protein
MILKLHTVIQKRAFLSYSSDAATYIDAFAPLFRPPAGDPEVYFYGDDPLAGGILYEELEAELSRAPVFLCFLNATYPRSAACLREFEFACRLQAEAGGARATERFFVPVLLDMKGKEFWNESIVSNKPAAWATGLVYTSLIDPKSGTHPIRIYIEGKLNSLASDPIQRLGGRVKRQMKW